MASDLLERGRIEVAVTGGSLLALGHACPYNEDGYSGTSTDTYYGRALAVIKAEAEEVTIFATGNGLKGEAVIEVNE